MSRDSRRLFASPDKISVFTPAYFWDLLNDARDILAAEGFQIGARENAPNLDLVAANALATALGLGLMVSGNSGALKEMGPAGNAVAQTWNAALAGFGTAEFNQKARQRQQPVRYRPPKSIKTEYETQAQSVIDARRSRPYAH